MNKLRSKVIMDETDECGRVVLKIDMYNMMFRNVAVATNEDPHDEDFTFWKYLTMGSISKYVRLLKPDKLIFAFDSRNYWRKDIYPEYKGHRKKARDKSVIDYNKFFPIAEAFWEDLKTVFTNVYFLRVDKVEADDIIAVGTKYMFRKDKVIAVTTDKDMYQLKKYRHYEQYHPIQKKLIQCLNPVKDLQIKLLMGDKGSDNIPPVRKGVGIKTAEKMLDKGLDLVFEEEPQLIETFKRNKRLIDFDAIPQHVITDITNAYENYEIKPFANDKLFSFLLKHKLGGLVEYAQDYNLMFRNLK